jgi:two-component system, sensor histidine kinase
MADAPLRDLCANYIYLKNPCLVQSSQEVALLCSTPLLLMPPSASSSALPPDDLFHTLLEVSLTGVILFRPVFEAEEIVDLAYDYLNPAAQRMLQQPERPTQTFRTLYPHAVAEGIFGFYRDTFLSGEVRRLAVNYQHDGLDNFFQLSARRNGELLVVSFSDTADHDRSAAEQALRDSQVRERAALADAEAQRRRLYEAVMQLPAQVVVHHGPDFVFEYVNPRYQQLFADRPLIGRPLREALPELDEAYFERFDHVYRTGETYYGTEMEAWLDYSNTGQLERRYFNLFFQALRDANGEINGLLNFAYDVTEQVVAREQVLKLNRELAEANQELHAAIGRVEHAQLMSERERKLLQAVLTQAPVAIALFQGDDQTVAAANDRICAMWGHAPEEVLGKPLLEGVPELRGQGFTELMAEVARTREPLIGSEVAAQLLQDGELKTLYFDFVYQPLYHTDGKLMGVLDIAIDVTTQVLARQQVELLNDELVANNTQLLLAQAELQELNQELENRVEARTHDLLIAQAEAERQRQRLHRLFMEAPAAICILGGPELVYELVNPSYQQIFSRRELLGKSLLEALPELTAHEVVRTFSHVLRTGQTHEEFGILIPVARHGNGPLEDRYFNYIQQARYDEHGQIDGVLVFAFEVTQQVEAQKVSEKNAQQLRLITDGLPALISYIDREERYRFTNQAYQHWFEVEASSLLGRTLLEVVGEKAYRNVKRYIDRAFSGERVDFDAVMPYRDDLIRHIRTSYVPNVQDGKVLGFYAMVSDITEEILIRQEIQGLNEELATINEELQVTNEELGEANQRLLRTNADLDNFVYTASHDLRAPITNLEGLLHALREELPAKLRYTSPVKPLLEMMQGAVDRFQLTISQLTEISKLQQSQHQAVETIDLATIIEDVRLDLDYMLRAGNVQLTVDVEKCPTVSFSPKNLRSIIYNLLSNAVKYRALDRQPVVHLRCHSTTHHVILEVEDNGLGLSEIQQSKLFTMFQRLHNHVEGTGVGLYMVKKIVENAGGNIHVLSRAGIGSTFTVTLPEISKD